MKSLAKSLLAAVAAGGLLAGCATYDYGYGYAQPYSYGYDYVQPYSYGYDYGYGPYSYDYGPYYYGYGPTYYGPSIGLGFTYRDRDYRHDGRNYSRNYDRHRNARNDNRRDRGSRSTATRPSVTHPQRNVAPANSRSRPVAPAPSQARTDPYGGTNQPFARNSQQ